MSVFSILCGIIALGVLIIVHELGHFILAKVNDVKVEEFSIGMGPKIVGIKGKETQYSIRALPIGGYVKMLGEQEKCDDARAFSNKSSLRKLSIVAAGPLMNFIFAIIIFSVTSLGGFPVPKIDSTVSGKPADTVLQKGDVIKEINNHNIYTWDDISYQVNTIKNGNLKLTIERDNKILNFNLKPAYDAESKSYMIGIAPVVNTKPSVMDALRYGSAKTISLTKLTFSVLGSLFTGKFSASDVGGPITIIKVSGKAVQNGFVSLLVFSAFLSVQLGIFNIIPFPALDGGYIFLFLFEIITRKKVNENKVGVLNYIGFTILMFLMVLVIIKDILYPINF